MSSQIRRQDITASRCIHEVLLSHESFPVVTAILSPYSMDSLEMPLKIEGQVALKENLSFQDLSLFCHMYA